MYKTSTKHAFLYFLCIGKLYSVMYTSTTATFYASLCILIHNKKYNIVCGIVSHNLLRLCPIRVYIYFILIIKLYRSRTQNKLFIYFCKLYTLYLNRSDTLRNRTNHGIVVIWCYIGTHIRISIYLQRCC